MKKIFNILLLLILIVPVKTMGQDPAPSVFSNQYPIYSQYLLDGLVINPAYNGTRDALSIAFSARKRMLGFEGESQMASFSLHSPLKNERIALGASIHHLTYGRTKQTSAFGYYAFHINTDKGKWSLGIKAGADMISTDYSNIPGTVGDPAFEVGEESYVLPNAGIGVYYVNPKYFFGAAIPALIAWEGNGRESDPEKPGMAFYPRYYDILVSAGTLFTISDPLKIKPSVLLRYTLNGNVRFDLNSNFILYDFLWLGASWRLGDNAVVGILELQLSQQLRLGYSYDYNLGVISSFIGGTHEVGLRFDFGKRVTASNPRFF